MTGTRREAQRAQTRRLVLDAACSLFEERGYERTTMRSVAKAAGVGLGTIFNHFPDKSALLVAAFEDDLGAVVVQGFATLPDSDLRTRFMHLADRRLRLEEGKLVSHLAERPAADASQPLPS